MTSKAAIRRALALLPDGAPRLTLAARLAELAGAGPIAPAEVAELLVAYLFDPSTAAILATTEDRARWFDGPLFAAVGPGNAAPLTDTIAALIVGPILANGGVLSPIIGNHRFAPRADDAIAIAVAALPRDAQAAALEQLAREPGPEPALLALSAVQCGRVLAWSPHLLDTAIAETIVADLLALLQPSRPRPLLDLAAAALGPIAATPGPVGVRVRDAAFAALDAMHRPPPTSFAAEIAAIGKTRRIPDQDRMMELPRREVAATAAFILGFAAPVDRDAFVAHRALVLDRPDGDDLFAPFVDGLVSAAHVPAVTELVMSLLADTGDGPTSALGLAAALPLDSLRDLLLAELDSATPTLRVLACAAVELLATDADDIVDTALAARLGDPSPEVAAAATHSLVARNRRDLIGKHSERETNPIRRAIALAALGELGVEVIGELARGFLADLDHAPEDASPLTRLLGDALLGSIAGLETAASLIGGVPEAAGMLALAAVPGADRDVGIVAPPATRARLASVTLTIATDPQAGELGALALYLLARVSAGDATTADAIATELEGDTGYAGNLVAAFGELRVANDRTAAALVPLLAATQPIGARVLAAAVSGRALPRDHAAWREVRELLELGTIARAAAWCALRDRARRS